MELTPKQQVVDILRNKQKFIIFTHKSPDGDAIGSTLAVVLAMKKLGKEVTAVCNDSMPAVFNYLKEITEIKDQFKATKDFVISLNVSDIKADKLLYKVKDNQLEIIISPKMGQFEPDMVTFPEGGFGYDAVICLDSTDLERLGEVYEKNAELFYSLPLVNIDHHSGNTHFGKINLIDMTATSTSEILVSVFEAMTGDPKFIDEPIATSLLTGIIADTNSFQNANTTPKSLTVAAQLVASGGRQQDIIKNIYKTKTLSTLRLWGRALSNLHDEMAYKFVWSELRKRDFAEVSATEDESGGLIDELLKTASGANFALLLSEKSGEVHGSLRSSVPSIDVAEIAKLFGGGGHMMAAAFQMPDKTLSAAAIEIIRKIKSYLKENNRI